LAVVAAGFCAATQFYGGVEVESAISSELSNRVEMAAHDYFKERPLEKVALWTNGNDLRKYLSDNLAEVSPEIELQRAGFLVPDLVISISPREPLVIWRVNGKKYFVDKLGAVFANNYYQSDLGIEVIDYNNMELGEKMPKKILSFLGQLIADVREEGINISGISIPAGKAREIDIEVVSGGEAVIFKLSIDRSTAEQVEDVSRIIRHFEQNKIKFGTLEYIDIRVKGRAFYR
jgi:hypothetical protein